MEADDAAIDLVARTLDAASTIGVVGHVGPDGDALGSMVALVIAAAGAGKTVVGSFDEPFVIPNELSFLDTSLLVPPSSFPDDLDVGVVVDTSVRKRVGSLADRLDKAGTLVVIDHHLSDGSWGDVLLIDRTAAATTELIFTVLNRLEWPITAAIANALYAGLVTDTGRFQYSSTSPATHEMAGALLAAGVKPDVIGQQLFEEASFGYYDVASKVLGRAVFDRDRAFVWSVLFDEDLEAADVARHEVDGLIDLVRLARGSQVALLLKESKFGGFKGSLRSRGIVDVAEIASLFGGGGHRNAAGFTASGGVDDIVEQITASLS
jgi:phosphoesterase RecJ-like protein